MKLHFLIFAIMAGTGPFCLAQEKDTTATAVDTAQHARLTGDYQSAITILAPIAKENPNDYAVMFGLGLAYVESGNTAKGVDILAKAKDLAITQKLADKQSLNSYGWALLLNGDYAGADKAFKDAESHWTELDQETKRKILNNEGLTLTYMGRYSDAEKYFTRAIDEFNSPLAKQNLKRVQELEKSTAKIK